MYCERITSQNHASVHADTQDCVNRSLGLDRDGQELKLAAVAGGKGVSTLTKNENKNMRDGRTDVVMFVTLFPKKSMVSARPSLILRWNPLSTWMPPLMLVMRSTVKTMPSSRPLLARMPMSDSDVYRLTVYVAAPEMFVTVCKYSSRLSNVKASWQSGGPGRRGQSRHRWWATAGCQSPVPGRL